VGESKAVTLQEYFKRIFPFCEIEVVRNVFSGDNAAEVLSGSPDYVIDAIDNRLTKAQLIQYCQSHQLPVISCMGAGGRVDPSRIQISRLTQTRNDPLCRIMRLVLKKMDVRLDDVTVVYSSEKPPGKLMELTDDVADNPDEYQLLPNFRVRIMPVLGTIPAMFGLVAATYVLNCLSQNEYEEMLPIKTSNKAASKMMCVMYMNEEKLYKASRKDRLITLPDAEYIISEVFNGRCFISGVVDNLALRRFNKDENVSCQNVILLSEALAKKHDKGEIEYTPEQKEKLKKTLQQHFLFK
jgi:molybdopterin/thiamine biosynthesis adenylyltransferase